MVETIDALEQNGNHETIPTSKGAAMIKKTESNNAKEWSEAVCNRRHSVIWKALAGVAAAALTIAGWLYQTTTTANDLARRTESVAATLKVESDINKQALEASIQGMSNRIQAMDTRQTHAIEVIDDRQQRVLEKLNVLCGELKGKGLMLDGSSGGGE